MPSFVGLAGLALVAVGVVVIVIGGSDDSNATSQAESVIESEPADGALASTTTLSTAAAAAAATEPVDNGETATAENADPETEADAVASETDCTATMEPHMTLRGTVRTIDGVAIAPQGSTPTCGSHWETPFL